MQYDILFLYILYFIYLICFLSRLRRLRHHHSFFELLHHLWLQADFRWPLRKSHLVDLVLELQQRKEESFRTRGASYNVHVYRYDAIHPLQNRISVKGPSHAGACSHRNAPLRVRHLFPHALQHRRHLQRHRARHDHQVRLARRRPEHFGSEPRHIEPRSRRSDHLDGAARQSKRERPDGALPRPVEHVVHRRNHEILFEPLIQYAHWSATPPAAFFAPAEYSSRRQLRQNASRSLPGRGRISLRLPSLPFPDLPANEKECRKPRADPSSPKAPIPPWSKLPGKDVRNQNQPDAADENTAC